MGKWKVVLILLAHFCVLHAEEKVSGKDPSCPCSDPAQCRPVQVPPRREILAFAVNPKSNYLRYDWTKLTTLAVFGDWDSAFLCFAHSKNVRVVLSSFIPVDQLLNETRKVEWVSGEIDRVRSLFADGINIDTESDIPKDSPQVAALTDWTSHAVQVFRDELPGSQVTFDVAWSPDGIDGRYYDHLRLSQIVDFVVVMSYDEQSQIFSEDCLALPNSGVGKTLHGVQRYLDIGVEKSKLVIGLPWYGYNYPCLKLVGNKCFIKRVPFRGVNCSDAAGRQYDYSAIKSKYMPMAVGGVQWDVESQSPFFNYEDVSDGHMHQVWFDDPDSLKIKYDLLLDEVGARGLAMWNVDCAVDEEDMWAALPSGNVTP